MLSWLKKRKKDKSRPGANRRASTIPIVYHDDYNITFGGLEKLHPFDSTKYGKIQRHLVERLALDPALLARPEEVSREQLVGVHEPSYLLGLKSPRQLAEALELPVLAGLPALALERSLLTPMRLATGGTVLGARLALRHGWAVNLSGGYHHAKRGRGEGFCLFNDVAVALHELWQERPALRALVVDLDAHQGNGNSLILGPDDRVCLLDMFNRDIYPSEEEAIAQVDWAVPLAAYTEGPAYLARLAEILPTSLEQADADLLIYNAGSDVFEDDPLGALSLTAADIAARDAMVVGAALDRQIPALVLLSGGYAPDSAAIVGQSLEALIPKMMAATASW